VAISTSLKRSFLEDAWDAAKVANSTSPDLRTQLRANETTARKAVAGGAIELVSMNGRTTKFAKPGAHAPSPEDVRAAWRELVDLYDSSKRFLEYCVSESLDPAATELNGSDTAGTPTAATDANLFVWMMDHLIEITEIQHDYSEAGCYR